jgi:tetratricopeptide (TPR) repeat protein
VATASIGTERIVLGRSASGRANDLLSGRWLAMEQLLTATPRQLNAQDAAMFYAQSWLLTHYLVVTPGANARFQAYLRAMRLGRSPLEAFTEGFGVTPAQMQAELRAYLRGNPNAIALTRPAAVEHSSVQRTRLPASADRLLPLSQRVISGMISDDDAPGVLARVRQLTGAAPADRYGVMALARAEEQLGSTTAARALLEQYLAAHPDDVEALYLMGSSYLRDAHAAEGDARTPLLSQARRYFVRGYRIDGNHVPTLMRYAETYSGVGMDQATFDNYLNVLLLAHQLAPQVDEISLNAAGALLGKDRPREAIPILRAIAYDPHAGGAAEAAQQLLAEAQRALAAAPAQP